MFQEGYSGNIYYRFFEAQKPVASVFAIHGLGGHCIWFDKAAGFFNSKNISFFSFDLPAFGQSKYTRGEIDSYKTWCNTTREILWTFLNNFKVRTPVYILGHSMGALIAVILTSNVKANGWILSVPGFEGDKKCFPVLNFTVPMLLKAFFQPGKGMMVPFGPEMIVKNKETQLKLKQDPLRVIAPSARVFFQVYLLAKEAKKLCSAISEPILMLQASEDIVCSNEAMVKCYEQIGSSDKTKIMYENVYHDLFIEDNLEKIVSDISSWIMKKNKK